MIFRKRQNSGRVPFVHFKIILSMIKILKVTAISCLKA